MKILQVIATVDPASGGPAESLRTIGSYLVTLGHTVEVTSCDRPDADHVRNFPIPVHAMGPGRGSYQYSPALKGWLWSHAAEYDAIVGRGIWQHHNLALRRAALRAKTPYWIFAHGMLDPWFNRASRIKAIKKRAYWPLQHKVLKDAQSVLFTSEEERLLARESFKPYDVRECVVSYGTSPPPVSSERAKREFLRAFPRLSAIPYLLFLGRLHPKKGCDILIEAFAASQDLSDRYLVMAGPDTEGYRSRLQDLGTAMGVQDRIVWTGMLSDRLKWGAFMQAEAFILPSHQENFGISVAESLSCGVPVLITRAVNIWREIEADGVGFVAEDTVAGVGQLLERWSNTPDQARGQMSRRAKETFESRYSVEGAAASLLAVLGRAR